MPVDMFLEFDKSAGIKGESTDKKFKDHIHIDGFDFGAECPTSVDGTTGLGAGKVHFNEFNFKMRSSLASPSCFKNMYLGTHIPTATLHMRKAGGGQVEYMTFKFKELLICKYSVDGGAEDPTESISFAYVGLFVKYSQQKADGSLGDSREAGWDSQATAEWLGS